MQLVEQKMKIGFQFRLNKYRKLIKFSILWTQININKRHLAFHAVKDYINRIEIKNNIWVQKRACNKVFYNKTYGNNFDWGKAVEQAQPKRILITYDKNSIRRFD